jgi:hypothetical protein
LLQHLRELVLHADKRSAQVDVEDAIPFFEFDLGERRGLVFDARVVERDVEPAERLDSARDPRLDLLRLDTSQAMIRTSPPASLIASAVCRSASSVRSRMATRAPSVANATAVARPMPLAAPVTKATLPGKRLELDMDCLN